jgi:hypothetical protein
LLTERLNEADTTFEGGRPAPKRADDFYMLRTWIRCQGATLIVSHFSTVKVLKP